MNQSLATWQKETYENGIICRDEPYAIYLAHFLAAQDYELQMRAKDKGVVDLGKIESCGLDSRLLLLQGDITRL